MHRVTIAWAQPYGLLWVSSFLFAQQAGKTTCMLCVLYKMIIVDTLPFSFLLTAEKQYYDVSYTPIPRRVLPRPLSSVHFLTKYLFSFSFRTYSFSVLTLYVLSGFQLNSHTKADESLLVLFSSSLPHLRSTLALAWP